MSPTSLISSSADEAMRAALAAREASLLASLAKTGATVDAAERGAHGVLRCDPPHPTPDWAESTEPLLRKRAAHRIEEWAAADGGGRVTLSSALVLPPHAELAGTPCSCRREAWMVQASTRTRRVQVVAALLSGLPPDGRTRQLIDVTWLDAVPLGAAALDGRGGGMQQGLPRLTALFASIAPPAERYDRDALALAMGALELPAADYAHLRAQPMLQPDVGECAQLTSTLAALGLQVCTWAQLDEPLGTAEVSLEALRLVRRAGPPEGTARADLAVRLQARLGHYLAMACVGQVELGPNPNPNPDPNPKYPAMACVGQVELGQRRWLTAADAAMRTSGGHQPTEGTGLGATVDPPATSVLEVLVRIWRHARADDARRNGVVQMLEWLGSVGQGDLMGERSWVRWVRGHG